jgi:hypothetical protein
VNIDIWHSPEASVLSDWIIAKTSLSSLSTVTKRELAMSDASSPKTFHLMPARIKEILYLDSPDIIMSISDIPLISIEISEEAGTGHNVFQRFSRLAAAVENNVAAFYIYPEAVWINRTKSNTKRWDVLNPLIFKTMENMMRIYDIPAFIYFFPTDYQGDTKRPPSRAFGPKGHDYETDPLYPGVPNSSTPQMKELLGHLEEMLKIAFSSAPSEVGSKSLKKKWAQDKRDWMAAEWASRNAGRTWSPQTATIEIDTRVLLDHLSKYAEKNHNFGPLLSSRPRTVIYFPKEKYRKQGDPYTGALASLDYLLCRDGKTYEDREKNLVIAFGDLVFDDDGSLISIFGPATIGDYVSPIQDLYRSKSRVLLGRSYVELKGQIPRYMMQVRHGTTYTKRKDLRIFAYFADAIIFPDGSLWREA